MQRTLGLWISAGLLACCAMAGCTNTGDGTGTYEAALCDAMGRCAAGSSCHSGVCLASCASDADCPSGAACRDGACWGAVGGSCASDADCAAGDACVAGSCATPPPPLGCTSDADCPAATLCDARGSCVTTCGAEACGDGVDGDCDGLVDEGCAGVDADRDGHDGVTDCDDSDASVHPGATEACNGRDDDCDGAVDEGCTGCSAPSVMCGASCVDLESDPANCGVCANACRSHEVCASGACVAPPRCASDADCPSGSRCASGSCSSCGPEVCGNGLDDDCDGAVDEGCGGCAPWVLCGTMCVDLESDPANCGTCGSVCLAGHTCSAGVCTASCGAEVCGNGIDDDCDGAIDEGCSGDGDGDGYAAPADCDDADPLVHPGAAERCNGIDDDCDGVVDESCSGMCRTDADCAAGQVCVSGVCRAP